MCSAEGFFRVCPKPPLTLLHRGILIFIDRYQHGKCTAVSRFALDLYFASHQLHESLYNAESQTDAAEWTSQ